MSRKQAAIRKSKREEGPPSEAEAAAIADASQLLKNRKTRLTVICEQSSDGRVEALGPQHSDRAGWLARIQNAFGTHGTAFALVQLNKLIAASRTTEGKVDQVTLNGLLAMIEGAEPQNEVQAALAVQMALTHAVAQQVLLRVLRVDQIPQFDSASNAAVKLLRTFKLQAEVLAKLQRGGEQIVKVVHVHPGAQAIVGNVVQNKIGEGGGGADENWNQPHAKVKLSAASASQLPQMWSEDSKRQPVPIAVSQR